MKVRLTDGIFKESENTGKKFIMSLDINRLLAPIAHCAGGREDVSGYYGGWEAYSYRRYKGNGITGHSLGHWLSAAAAMYYATGDSEVKSRLDYAVDRLYEYQRTDGTGYIGGVRKERLVNDLKAGKIEASGFELNGYWVPWYSFHKIYRGLVDAYRYAGNETALKTAEGFADWAYDVTSSLTDEQFARMLECEYGGMNEVMAQLYGITGKRRYYELAVKFTHKSILSPLSEHRDELQGKHANTQIPKIIGAAAIYDQDPTRTDYRAAAEFFYDTVVNRRSYVIGGNSNREHFGALSDEVLGTQTLETCNTHNMLTLTEYLYSWNHRAEYMDYYERALFNHILASQDPDTGEKTYFMATNYGHFKVYSDALGGNSFWCCTGSGMENPARYTRNIYYLDGDDFYVNQFIASYAEIEELGITVSQTTKFPYEDTSVIKIENGGGRVNMKIRIPSWIDGAAEIKVNGEAEAVTESGYFEICREWSAGDVIRVRLPMGLRVYTARDDKRKTAFLYGPVVLAGALGRESFPPSDRVDDHTSLDNFTRISVPDIITDDKHPDTFIKMTDKSRLEFEMKSLNGAVIRLAPYFDLHHQRYSLYWRLYGSGERNERDELADALDAVTLDTVFPNEQQPEVDHNMQKSHSISGYMEEMSRGWRCALGADGYFSYDLKTDPSKGTNYVMAVYCGSDAPFEANGICYRREFEIMADNAVIGSEIFTGEGECKPVYRYYQIPPEILSDKDKITVTFRPKGNNTAAGGVFEVRTTTGNEGH